MNLEDKFTNVNKKTSQREKEAIERTADLLEKAETLYNENTGLVQRIEEMEAQFKISELDWKQKLEEIDVENQALIKKMLRLSKGKLSITTSKELTRVRLSFGYCLECL